MHHKLQLWQQMYWGMCRPLTLTPLPVLLPAVDITPLIYFINGIMCALHSGSAHRMFLLDASDVAPAGADGGACKKFMVLGATGNVYEVSSSQLCLIRMLSCINQFMLIAQRPRRVALLYLGDQQCLRIYT